MAEARMQSLLIRFRGICAHIDVDEFRNGGGKDPAANGGKRKRTVLVRHRNGTVGIEHHIPYVEFLADDLESLPRDMRLLQYSKPGVDGIFARVDLDETTVIQLNDDKGGWVEEDESYRRGVPRMSDVLEREQVKPAARLLEEDLKKIDTTRATAVFDMPKGRLVAGEPEPTLTRFREQVGVEPRRYARWADLYAEVKEPVKLTLIHLSNGSPTVRTIAFKPTLRMLTIGNEPERLILGVKQTSDFGHTLHRASHHDPQAATPQPSGHYILYYDILENPPDHRPVPIPTQIDGAGCPNNNYP